MEGVRGDGYRCIQSKGPPMRPRQLECVRGSGYNRKGGHMSIRKAGALALFLAGAAAAATCGGHGTRESLLVSTKWLADHMKDANLVVLAVGEKADYDAEHIAGSQFIESVSYTHLRAHETR